MSLKERLCDVDNGRFKDLIEVINTKDICLKCSTFNQTLEKNNQNFYLCAIPAKCIGITLDSGLISYLLWRIGEKSENEHKYWIGP